MYIQSVCIIGDKTAIYQVFMPCDRLLDRARVNCKYVV